MFDPDRALTVQGSSLVRLIAEVRREFFSRPESQLFGNGLRQVNSVRVVALDVYEQLAVEAQLDVVGDLLRHNEEVIVRRPAESVFEAADSPAAYVTDLVCEVIVQTLYDDPAVQLEDDCRQGVASSEADFAS